MIHAVLSFYNCNNFIYVIFKGLVVHGVVKNREMFVYNLILKVNGNLFSTIVNKFWIEA